jgi:putative transposase
MPDSDRADNRTEELPSVLSDPPEVEAPLPSLDDISPDELKPNSVVVIRGHICQFLYHEEHGPHYFFNTETRKQLPLHTSEIVSLMNSNEYFRPGGDTPSSEKPGDLDEAGRQYLRMAFGSIREKPRKAAAARFMYVGYYLSLIYTARADGTVFAKNAENAQRVVDEVDAAIEAENQSRAPAARIMSPKCRQPRTVLDWVKKEFDLGLGEVGQVHGNAIKHHDRKLPEEWFTLIAVTIREALTVSGKMTPTKIYNLVVGKLRESGAKTFPSKSTVYNEYCRYDPYSRLAKRRTERDAELEYGAVGKLQRPKRVNDLWQIDHHKFDVNTLLGELPWTETSLPRVLSRAGIDRFWICAAIDGCSNYCVGFCISFDPDGLAPALTCVDHAVRIKTYVETRWPDIKGALLGHGPPVRVQLDNAKAWTSIQTAKCLARVGIGFVFSRRRRPDDNPYAERTFGTWERDFVEWLRGATGSSPKEKGDRNPVKEAKVEAEDFIMLFHQYLIECYSRRPQKELGWRSPEQVYGAALEDPTCRPRPLTKSQLERFDLIASYEITATITSDGISWKGLYYQSPELQELRCPAGFNHKTKTIVSARIPVKNIGIAFVAPPPPPPGSQTSTNIPEIVVPCTNPHVQGLELWQHEVVLAGLKARKKDPNNWADYQAGFLRLFRNAVRAMGVQLPGEKAPKPRLTGGHAPRFVGVFQPGPTVHALQKVKDTIERYDIFGEIAAVAATQAGPKKHNDDALREAEERISKWTSDPITLEGDSNQTSQ